MPAVRFTSQLPALILFLLMINILGCSSGEILAPPLLSKDIATGEVSHQLWGYWRISLDEERGAEVVPVREMAAHYNVIGFLEQNPCADCLRVVALQWGQSQVDLTIQLRHPFPGLKIYTGFDVRGTGFLPGTFEFPDIGITIPDFETENHFEPLAGQSENYTTLFNPVTYPENLPFGYGQGKLTPWPKEMLTSTAGYFQYFTKHTDPAMRNMFETTDVISVDYRIARKTGGPLVFGYAVDASWVMPELPVIVPDSFGPYANCPEAWKIGLDVNDSGLTPEGGELLVRAVVYDWQDVNTIGDAFIQAPAINSTLIKGDVLWDDTEAKTRAFQFTVPNIELSSLSGDWLQFMVMAEATEPQAPGALVVGRALVGGVSGCPGGIHNNMPSQGTFMQFGNYTIPPADAAILTMGDYAGEFIMFGNGFAGSMMGSYYIGDTGPNEPHGLVGLVGLGGPTSLDVSPVSGHIFLVMPLYDESKNIKIYGTSEEPQILAAPNGGSVNSLDVTPENELWFIEYLDGDFYLHHAIPTGEWIWGLASGDSQQILAGSIDPPHVFDLVYEPVSKRVYVLYLVISGGSIAVYDASQPGPPVYMPGISKDFIWGSAVLDYIDGGFYSTGADIEIDMADAGMTGCRLVAFANLATGTTRITKFDSELNELNEANVMMSGPFSTFAVSVDADLTKRTLIFLPLYDFADEYFIFDPPVDW